MDNEIWKPIYGYEGLYEVSNLGWVRSAQNTGLVDNKGERHGMSKLTVDEVLAIRKSTGSTVAVGKEFGVSPQTISDIRLRNSWSHLDDAGVKL